MIPRKLLLLLALLVLLLAGLLMACGETEEPAITATTTTQSAATSTATPIATPIPTATVSGNIGGGELPPPTIVPAPSPVASPAPIPADWATFTDPRAPFTVRFPPSWGVQAGGGGNFWAINPATTASPASGMAEFQRIEVYFSTVEQAEPKSTQATNRTVAGISGWQIVYTYDPAKARNIARVHEVGVDRNGMRLRLVAYFGSGTSDEETFLQVVSSMRFIK